MHWNATDVRYHEALRRLAVVLLMLAGIAENAASRSWPMRSLLIWLLSRAEARVRSFAARAEVPPFPAEFRRVPMDGEAARLARRFRALAIAFFALSQRASLHFGVGRRHRRQFGHRLTKPLFGRQFVASIYADTS